jgi:hypothetical protein
LFGDDRTSGRRPGSRRLRRWSAAVGLGEVRCVEARVTAGCVGAGANQRQAKYPRIAAMAIPNIIFVLKKAKNST